MNKVLIVVDCQNDFIDGTLKNNDAIDKIPKIVDYIKNFNGNIICTLDTHDDNYFETLEGKMLPVKHCIVGTNGWELNEQIKKALEENTKSYCKTIVLFRKYTFGDIKSLPNDSTINNADEIYMLGFCTDICVISNALILRAKYPNKKINVLGEFCAGTSIDAHNSALTVMKSCQINIV